MDVIASPPAPDGTPGSDWRLTVEIGEFLVVRETVSGDRLPAFCPELHVNLGGDFCLGLEAFASCSEPDVKRFWKATGEFLNNQEFAAKHGYWPSGRWLSHGDGADHQQEAERIAAEAAWADEYAAWIENQEGWLAGPLPRLSKDRSRLVNARSPCPRGCRARRGRIIVRSGCRHRVAVEGIIRIEYARQAAERDFFESLYRKEKRCCRRMRTCPLGALEESKKASSGPRVRAKVEPLWKRRQRRGTKHA